MIPVPILVTDAIIIPSDVAIPAPAPVKASVILQYKELSTQRSGNPIVERLESWTKFGIDPLTKLISTMNGSQDPIEGLLLQELGFASILD